MLNNFVGVRDVTAAVAAPPRIRPTIFDTNDKDGTEMLAHIFMRVAMVAELRGEDPIETDW